jgi:hypothetical protein
MPIFNPCAANISPARAMKRWIILHVPLYGAWHTQRNALHYKHQQLATRPPERTTTMKMHSFQIDADAQTGNWIEGTAQYLGLVDSDEHYAKRDTSEYHFDQHDGKALAQWVWNSASVERTTANVAITLRYI